ncbi:MAG: hypothetical protein M3O25_03700 [Actinomycetota bacterium]|nr:hypothetical protein [Actinomycetota bacterium]
MVGRGTMGSRRLAAAIGALALIAGLLVAEGGTPASAEPAFACGHVHTGKAKGNPNPKGRPPLAIGDSTMLLPIPNLTRVGYTVNGKGCRGFRQSIAVIKQEKKAGRLPHLVAVAAYSNGGLRIGLVRQALKAIGPKRVLVLVTQYDGDTGEPYAAGSEVLYAAEAAFPRQVAVLDWVEHSLPHHTAAGGWFLGDLYHPNFEGAEAYARFLKRAFPYAREGRFPG